MSTVVVVVVIKRNLKEMTSGTDRLVAEAQLGQSSSDPPHPPNEHCQSREP